MPVHVIPRPVPLSSKRNIKRCPSTGVPLGVSTVIAPVRPNALNTSVVSPFGVNVPDVAPAATALGFTLLLVSVCVSVVPTTVQIGAVTVVIVEVQLQTTRPVNVVAPVPPLATGNVPVT